MTSKNIGYHTRLRDAHSVKCSGGSFGGAFDLDTINRLVKSHFDVVVKPSGTPVFVDRTGREVSLYVTVDPHSTTKGVEALQKWRAEAIQREAEASRLSEMQQKELEDAMSCLSHEEIILRLTE